LSNLSKLKYLKFDDCLNDIKDLNELSTSINLETLKLKIQINFPPLKNMDNLKKFDILKIEENELKNLTQLEYLKLKYPISESIFDLFFHMTKLTNLSYACHEFNSKIFELTNLKKLNIKIVSDDCFIEYNFLNIKEKKLKKLNVAYFNSELKTFNLNELQELRASSRYINNFYDIKKLRTLYLEITIEIDTKLLNYLSELILYKLSIYRKKGNIQNILDHINPNKLKYLKLIHNDINLFSLEKFENLISIETNGWHVTTHQLKNMQYLEELIITHCEYDLSLKYNTKLISLQLNYPIKIEELRMLPHLESIIYLKNFSYISETRKLLPWVVIEIENENKN
jgi:hypothetical protein